MTLLGRWPRPKRSSDRAVIGNALRCCLHISSVSRGSAASDCAGLRCPSRVHAGSDRAEPSEVGQALRSAATAARAIRGVSVAL